MLSAGAGRRAGRPGVVGLAAAQFNSFRFNPTQFSLIRSGLGQAGGSRLSMAAAFRLRRLGLARFGTAGYCGRAAYGPGPFLPDTGAEALGRGERGAQVRGDDGAGGLCRGDGDDLGVVCGASFPFRVVAFQRAGYYAGRPEPAHPRYAAGHCRYAGAAASSPSCGIADGDAGHHFRGARQPGHRAFRLPLPDAALWFRPGRCVGDGGGVSANHPRRVDGGDLRLRGQALPHTAAGGGAQAGAEAASADLAGGEPGAYRREGGAAGAGVSGANQRGAGTGGRAHPSLSGCHCRPGAGHAGGLSAGGGQHGGAVYGEPAAGV